ncbi:phosphatidylethanolamine N-methyltransferase [Kwoniella heveanensis BCC8398]|uniref:Phosphatidylethanolamine N-methyltransferase n=1 Tax=Kwoniella heveanensis BCC8398 TaxID=1296120 RepID=A0A1B9GIK4_9TREE|nr:phosphatidylethanolamine N-methyltransferase [Kwoniella heveanensis BCC8398]
MTSASPPAYVPQRQDESLAAGAVTATATATATLGSQDNQSTIRQRKVQAQAENHHADNAPSTENDDEKNTTDKEEEVNWGKTPSGEVFRVPATHSFLHTMLTTTHRSSLTRATLFSLLAQPLLFYLLRNHNTIRSAFFLLYFAFWRGAYDWGFAWVLRKQSEKKWVVRLLKNRGWLDTDSDVGGEEGKAWARWWKRELEMKMGEGYRWEDVPDEFNAWLMFRQLVDVVLLNDFVSYTCFAWSNLHFPPNHSLVAHIFRWAFGWALILFNLWVKMDAHRVVKDYAWYWGDAFWLMVMQHDLVFDGVYEIAPHPMYSVGYAGYYGLSMVVGSYTVLFVSLAAHAAQFAFLLWFENPHIERTYGGGKKPLVSRAPLAWEQPELSTTNEQSFSSIAEEGTEGPTPSATEGEHSTSFLTSPLCETETESELPELPPNKESNPIIRKPRSDSDKKLSMHDLTHRFFRKPAIVLSQLDMFRATDFALTLLITYALSTLIPPLSPRFALAGHFLHALLWRLFHSYGLGLLLRAQSKSKWLVRHYLKHYHYPGDGTFDEDDEGEAKESVVKRATEEAFGNWQVVYNVSLVMTYVSFIGLAWKTYHLPMDWTVSGTILRHFLGFSLIALHIWSAVSSYEVLGDFGWLYSDFFLIEQIPSQLAYTGIYRFLNNPERSMGGAAFFGMWLISNSKLVFVLALMSHLGHLWFLSFVEQPHMKKLYGDRLRKDGGLTKTLKNVADKTLSTKGGKRGSELRRVVQEVKGSIEKVEERVTEAVEEFLDHARPMFSDMVHDTKILLQHSRERMIITRVANDISAYDPSRYSLTLPTSSASPVPRYHVGQPIRVSWTAPSNHSRKDWIGIYRLGSCKSTLVTRISSVGKWMPIYEEEWDGDTYLDPVDKEKKGDAGEVLFKGEQLPWMPGQYEVRYHHDGKHNVMSRVAPIEIYVSKPENPDSIRSIRSTLLNIVCLSLDQDEALIPRSARRKLRSPSSASASASASASVSSSGPASLARSRAGSSHQSIGSALSALAEAEGTGAKSPIIIKPDSGASLVSPIAVTKDVEENIGSTPTARSISIPQPTGRGGMRGSDRLDVDVGPDEELFSTSPSSIDLHMPRSYLQSQARSLSNDSMEGGGDFGAGAEEGGEGDDEWGGEYDDFVIMTETQAKRISDLSEMAFGVEVSKDVVVAEANVTLLARRVAGARGLKAGVGGAPSPSPGLNDGGDKGGLGTSIRAVS